MPVGYRETSPERAGDKQVLNFYTSKISYFLLMVARLLNHLKFTQDDSEFHCFDTWHATPDLKPKDTQPSLASRGPCCTAFVSAQDKGLFPHKTKIIPQLSLNT